MTNCAVKIIIKIKTKQQNVIEVLQLNYTSKEMKLLKDEKRKKPINYDISGVPITRK